MEKQFESRYPKVVETVMGSIPLVSSICHHNLSCMFLIAAQRIQNVSEVLTRCLRSNPYEGLSPEVVNLLVNLIMLVVEPNPNIQGNTR
jgi:hypothetical protein